MTSNTRDLAEDDENGTASYGPRNQGLTYQPSSSESIAVAETASRLHAVPPVQAAEKRKLRRVKKPQEMPSRPLSAYNLFFKEARIEWLAEADQVAALEQDNEAVAAREPPNNPDGTRKRKKSRLFEKMAKEIGRRWKALTPTRKRKFEELAEIDKQRYRLEMNEYQEKLVRQAIERDDSKNAKPKKTKKASFPQAAQAREKDDDEKKPRARENPPSSSTSVSEFERVSSQPELSGLPSIRTSLRNNNGTGSAPIFHEGRLDSTSHLAPSVQQALVRDEELRLMATAVARQPPPNAPANWQELVSISNLLNGNNALQASQLLAGGTQAPTSGAPPIDYYAFLQEQQRLGALGLSHAHRNQHFSQEHRFSSSADPTRASHSRSDRHETADASNIFQMLLQQELQRRSQISTRNPSTLQLEQSMRQEQFEGLLRSQQGHQAQGSNSTTSSQTFLEQELQRLSSNQAQGSNSTTSMQTFLEQELQRLSSNTPASFVGNSGASGGLSGQGLGQQLQDHDPTNPYEVMALLSFLSQQEQQNHGSQVQHGTRREQHE